MLAACWFPGSLRGGKREHGSAFALSTVAAPATVSGEPVVRVSHWETGKAGRQAVTREPGDLPAQSPNRWAGEPHGAAVRSGDDRCGGRVNSFTTPRLSDVRTNPTARRAGGVSWQRCAHASFASGPVQPGAPPRARPPASEGRVPWKTLYIASLNICAALHRTPRGSDVRYAGAQDARHDLSEVNISATRLLTSKPQVPARDTTPPPRARARTITAAPTSREPSRPVEGAPQPAAPRRLRHPRRLRAF